MNLSPIIAKWMKEEIGIEVKSGYILNFHKLSDIAIYNKARAYGKIILISKDADFQELISRLGAPPKLINLKIGNCDNRFLWATLKLRIHEMLTVLTRDTDGIDIVELEL